MKNENRLKRGGAFKVVFIIAFILFMVYSLTMIFAFCWTVLNSLKSRVEFNASQFSIPIDWLQAKNPIVALFANYSDAFTKITNGKSSLLGMMFNSIWFAVFTAALPLFFTSMTSYAFAKYNFVGKRFLYAMVIVIMMVPIMGSLPASYSLMHRLHLVNSPLILICYMSGFGGHFLMLLAAYKGVSWSYAEAAQIDGANGYAIYFKIMMPQIVPPMFALFILNFIAGWNDYLTPYLYLKDMPTLATGLMEFEKASIYRPNWPVFYAGVVMMSIPIVLIFILLSDKIMSKVSIGGLKG